MKSEPITGREHNIRGLKKKSKGTKRKRLNKRNSVVCVRVCVCVCF